MSKVLRQKAANGEVYLFSQGPRKRMADGKQASSKRISYGKILADGSFQPNAYYQGLSIDAKRDLGIEENPQPSELEKQLNNTKISRGRPKEILQGFRKTHGDSYLLMQVAQQLKVTSLLKQYWPGIWDKLLSIALFMSLNHEDSLYLIQSWSRTHTLPAPSGLSSGNLSRILDAVEEDDRQNFLKDWAALRPSEDTYCVDGSSFSSMSQYLRRVRWGSNKEHDPYEQINVLVAFGNESHLPLFISSHSGNIPDVSTMEDFAHNMYGLDVRNTEFCFDRGYCSVNNITTLIKRKHKFILAANSLTAGYIKHALNAIRKEELTSLSSYNDDKELHGITREIEWSYQVNGEGKASSTARLYLHIFYNPQMALDKQKHEFSDIKELERELTTKPIRSHLEKYEKYFTIHWGSQDPYAKPEYDAQLKKKRRPVLTPPASFSMKPVSQKGSQSMQRGLFVLISNSQSNCWEAHRRYLKRTSVEKAFMNLKTRIGLRRIRSGQQSVVDSRLFIAFISLILVSELERRMSDTSESSALMRKYNPELLMKEFASIDQYHYSSKARHVTPVTKKQQELYALLGVDSPARVMTEAEQARCEIS
ncbi:MAG: transposase [Sphaerochaetaceae bacterium]|nr:transposase [Sphaerochaetaceae bacterium]